MASGARDSTKGHTGAAIAGFGHSLPSDVLDNDTLIARYGLEVTPGWIEAKTGIVRRHWLPDGETTSDMAVDAASKALANAGCDATRIDRIVLATISPDNPSPATATVVARKLGVRCPAFDVSAACAGFVYALDLAVGSAVTRDETVLVIAADARSRFIDRHERRGAVLFSDGAAAAVVVPSPSGPDVPVDRPGILGVFLGAEGRLDPGVHMPAGGASLPTTAETVAAGLNRLVVDPAADIYEHFTRLTREATHGALVEANCTLDDVDAFVAHQGNARMVEMVRDDLGLPDAIVVNEVHRHGNTAGASMAIVVSEAIDEGRLGPGDVVLLAGVGAGYTFGGAVVRLGPPSP